METTLWHPEGEHVSLAERQLRTLVRANLPSVSLIDQPAWAFGRYVRPVAGAGDAGEGGLDSLDWRMVENLDWQRRAATFLVFSGVARRLEKRVDFSGECIRDCSSGAFLEFSMITVGLRA